MLIAFLLLLLIATVAAAVISLLSLHKIGPTEVGLSVGVADAGAAV